MKTWIYSHTDNKYEYSYTFVAGFKVWERNSHEKPCEYSIGDNSIIWFQSFQTVIKFLSV
jgi:hypothetical protein